MNNNSNPFKSSRFNNLDDDNEFHDKRPKTNSKPNTNLKPNTNSKPNVNSFSKNDKSKIELAQNINNKEVFPDLIPFSKDVVKREECSKNIIKFADILNNNSNDNMEEQKEHYVEPGWIEITREKDFRKIVYTCGKTKNDKIKNQSDIENINDIMDIIIEKIKLNRQRYIEYYDEIHGLGAFEETFTLPPVYGPEYDSEEEEEGEDEFYEDDDYDNENY
jgi:hypothetical protein